MRKLLTISSLVIALLSIGCKPPIPAPAVAILQLPADNTTCLDGLVTAEKSSVNFSWLEAANTDSYLVVVQNEETRAMTQKTVEQNTQANLSLDRGFPYSWWVITSSIASSEETKSAVNAFYLEGDQQLYFIPFPAKLIYPPNNSIVSRENGQIQLIWSGTDLDNDIEKFELFFGDTADQLNLITQGQTTTYFIDVETLSTYYWMVRTTDSQGNISESNISYFQTVN